MSEFKAGDVVEHVTRGRGIVLEVTRGEVAAAAFADGMVTTGDLFAGDLRRLAVIDPESAEDVKWLVGHDAFLGAMAADHDIRAMQVALREHAELTPEPLAEPTDLSARVLDKDGDEWARIGDMWVCSVFGISTGDTWDQMTAEYGPLRLAGDE